MTTPETLDTPADEPTPNETPAPEPTAAEPDPDTQTGDSGKEAAKFRKQLRAVEKERDTLATQLEAMRRAETERLASQHLADGADIWRDGAQLADLLDNDGNLDPARIAEVATNLTGAHPHWRRREPGAPPATEVTSRDKIEPGDEPSWSKLLQGRNSA